MCIFIARKGCLKHEVILTLSSTKISKGYYVTGEVETELKLKCRRCGTGFFQPFKGKFQVWTNSKANDFEDCVDYDEVPFPHSSNYLDLSEVCRMILLFYAKLFVWQLCQPLFGPEISIDACL